MMFSSRAIATNTDFSLYGVTNNEDMSLPANVIGLVDLHDETQSSKTNGVTINHNVTLNVGRDAKLPSDFSDMDMDDVGGLNSQKDVEAKESGSNMAVISDAVAAAESSKISSPSKAGCVQTLAGIVATNGNVTEDKL
ncbi:hypothetical protein Tco_1066004, partial [Tanacetum coccineum]